MDYWIGLGIQIYWWTLAALFTVCMLRPRSRRTFFALLVQDPKLLPRRDDDED